MSSCLAAISSLNWCWWYPCKYCSQNVCETQMNLTYIHLKSVLAQSTFIASLPTNDSYKKYYGSTQMTGSKSLIQFFRTAIMDAGNVCWWSLIWQRFIFSQAMLLLRCSIELLYFDCSGHQECCGLCHQGRGWQVWLNPRPQISQGD
jgi:hypothetical protein